MVPVRTTSGVKCSLHAVISVGRCCETWRLMLLPRSVSAAVLTASSDNTPEKAPVSSRRSSPLASRALPAGDRRLFDHLVRAEPQLLRYFDAECFRRSRVNDEVEFGRLFDWQISGARAFQNSININGDFAAHCTNVRKIHYHRPRFGVRNVRSRGRDPILAKHLDCSRRQDALHDCRVGLLRGNACDDLIHLIVALH